MRREAAEMFAIFTKKITSSFFKYIFFNQGNPPPWLIKGMPLRLRRQVALLVTSAETQELI